MPQRSRNEAINSYRRPLQSVLSCLTKQGHFQPSDCDCNPNYKSLLLTRFPIAIGEDRRFVIDVAQAFLVEEIESNYFQVRTKSYSYSLFEKSSMRELISYHWHPETSLEVPFPHLHLKIAKPHEGLDLTKIHFPTGMMSFQDFARSLIREFGVKPVREDWQAILMEALSEET